MATIKNYPKKDGTPGHHPHYAKVPMQLTADDKAHKKDSIPPGAKIGDWIAVEIVEGGYVIKPNQIPFKKMEDCQKACDIHNSYHGWNPRKVYQILRKSMA